MIISPNGPQPQRMVDVPDDSKVGRLAVVFQGIYSILGMALGAVCIVGGFVLFIHGIKGSSNWVVKILGLESNISDAAPGAILFLVGLLTVVVTRYAATVRDKK